ncbi:universal stress protein [Paractinoplanes brasiliensis]|uniref:Nucleotide-binding universal stress UspA family protein n=1 Tax=Paractinoplanes brasiliensis TaxID=52695 RepID=A0A4R6JMM2_9ACTN|nr:universal stress protein [Actinoplanes brasiliensis]TDO37389.1 nucleotide-binding universal stress UspA family protein [Actinoplanes brasiliensis]GID29295.1 universal stress protein A [Actinoplanes brasiliensis]
MKDGPGTILVGIDGSTSSLRAAAYAAGLARRQGSKLVALYVRTHPSALLPLADTGGAVATVIDTQDAVEQELRAMFAERLADLDLDAHLVVRTGEPYAEILDTAHELRADAVIVGRSVQALHRITGSLGSKLVRCGRWPVTVVP